MHLKEVNNEMYAPESDKVSLKMHAHDTVDYITILKSIDNWISH